MPRLLRAAFFAFVAVCTTSAPIAADELQTPTQTVVLTVSGDIGAVNVDDTAQFDLEMLMSFDPVTIETTTIWTEGEQIFEGVALQALLERLEVTNGTVLATAINNYTVEIPVTDAVVGGPIVAYLLNGDTMSVREKGPLWIVYPYDASADYRSEVIYSRSIWQLDRIEIVQ
ncbi:molybdopterin-dependent oxidoreductase [Yoonia sp. I 8.24]|uniref:molybdopterin-dependent oxidoreductase n=1 Tax=Yoonia sp. I 8.24 TaxID=1537229 RepID=UPI001EE017AF|nr:molybdopterin-dependent oxidoreductase [Yoonia sp. I 8.24]MCG3268370.1 oxidoreductase [Yoonia sp. I 8.24]